MRRRERWWVTHDNAKRDRSIKKEDELLARPDPPTYLHGLYCWLGDGYEGGGGKEAGVGHGIEQPGIVAIFFIYKLLLYHHHDYNDAKAAAT